ncbi:MAG: Npun_F0296 family exosortase-dependent surface protein, partial [Nostoc sp.]
MSTLQKLSLALVGTAVLLISANPASAVSLTTGSGISSAVAGTTTVDFESGAPTTGFAKYSSPVGTPTVVQGTKPNEYAAPAGDTSKYLTIAPQGSNVAGNTDSVTIDFAQALDYFGLYWGSVDLGNSIAFYNGNTLLNTFSGNQVSTT